MNKTWYQHLWYWKLAVARCLIYGTIVVWGVLKAGTEGYDHLGDIPPIAKLKLLGDSWQAFAGVLLAFLDSTLSVLRSNENVTRQVKLTHTDTVEEKPNPVEEKKP